MENIIGIVVGFVLTTVAGGWWAARLQERSWASQNDVRMREAENERAGAACQDVTSLLDRRLYRMLRLLWAATRDRNGPFDQEELERRRLDYVEVLFAFNDVLNVNLSLAGSYFGDDARASLDALYEDFKRVGQDVEAVVRLARAGEDTRAIAERVAAEFRGRQDGSLNDRVYQFGVMLMSQLREGEVGRYAPKKAVPRPAR